MMFFRTNQNRQEQCEKENKCEQCEQCRCHPCNCKHSPHPCCQTGATGPTGADGTAEVPLQTLQTYSTAPQSGTSGSPLIFDQNTANYGTALQHTAPGSTVNVTEPGVYMASFQGTFSAGENASFPESVLAQLYVNNNPVSKAATNQNLQNEQSASELSFTAPFTVSSVPASVQVQVQTQGDSFLYNDVGLTIWKLGNLPSESE